MLERRTGIQLPSELVFRQAAAAIFAYLIPIPRHYSLCSQYSSFVMLVQPPHLLLDPMSQLPPQQGRRLAANMISRDSRESAGSPP